MKILVLVAFVAGYLFSMAAQAAKPDIEYHSVKLASPGVLEVTCKDFSRPDITTEGGLVRVVCGSGLPSELNALPWEPPRHQQA